MSTITTDEVMEMFLFPDRGPKQRHLFGLIIDNETGTVLRDVDINCDKKTDTEEEEEEDTKKSNTKQNIDSFNQREKETLDRIYQQNKRCSHGLYNKKCKEFEDTRKPVPQKEKTVSKEDKEEKDDNDNDIDDHPAEYVETVKACYGKE